QALHSSVISIKDRSRLVQIAVRANNPDLCTTLANLFVEAIAANTNSQGDERGKQATKLIEEKVNNQRARLASIAQQTAAQRIATGMDSIRIDLEVADRALSRTTTDLLSLEGEEARLIEMMKILTEVANDPTAHANLLSNDPRSKEIANLTRECMEKEEICRAMLTQVTKRHPMVRQAGRELLAARSRLKSACRRAKANGEAALIEIRPRIEALKKRKTELEEEKAHNTHLLAKAEEETMREERNLKAAHATMETLLLEQNRITTAASQRRETIVPGCPADTPEKPVIPDPELVYPTSIFIFTLIGIVFALMIDGMNDPFTDVWDVIRRVGCPILAALPHATGKSRSAIVRKLHDDPRSTYSESVRTLLQRIMSQGTNKTNYNILVVSTCPGEGKTITSASLAAAFAQSGLKTILADFDLRRPQQASVWNLSLTKEKSFSHALMTAKHNPPNFPSIVNKTYIPNLDVIATLPPDDTIDPATAVGSTATRAFFAWAKTAYEAIIIDAPPFGTVGDVVALSNQVDSVILMCRPDRTNASHLSGCVRYLSETSSNVLGIVINDSGANGRSFTPEQKPIQHIDCPAGADPLAFEETRQFADED
ncbi:MAG: AAA family ATPase, partial [Kiritimatiellae bacterium]|nr:AAA family ATPase [Kiritimatiellia bacterium]